MIPTYKRHTTTIDPHGAIKKASMIFFIPSHRVWVDIDGYCYKAHNPHIELVKMIKVDFPEDLANRVSEFAKINFQDVEERFIIQLKLKNAFSL
jgi:hypothetical protein